MHFKIASYPGRGNPNNPYVDLFYNALEPHGVTLAGELEFNIDWLKDHSEQLNAIHVHWPEIFWREYTPFKENSNPIRSFIRTKFPAGWRLIKLTDQLTAHPSYQKRLALVNKIKGYFYFRKFLAKTHQLGLRIIWTFHNAENHEGSDFIDHLGYKYLAKSADLIIFHSEIAQNDFLKHHQLKGQAVLMPHGNYDGVYPPERPKETILKELGLRDNLPIVSCIGMLRSYKGLDTAVQAMALLEGEVQFLCAGYPHPSFDITSLQEQIAKLPNAVLIPKFLSNQEFSDYTSISDCLLMPYKKITGSGALLAALTLSRGVITSDLPYFREILANHSDSGTLVPAENPQLLANSIKQYLAIPAIKRNLAARSLAEDYNWNKVILPVANIINSLN